MVGWIVIGGRHEVTRLRHGQVIEVVGGAPETAYYRLVAVLLGSVVNVIDFAGLGPEVVASVELQSS